LLAGGIYDFASLALPLSRYILSEFQKRCQYDLADQLSSLFWDVGNYRKVRFDYYQTAHDLWKENYFRTLFLWCDRNNLLFTGHGLEHEWPDPWLSPADGSFYAYEHAPGIDLLRGAEIRKNGSDPWRLFHIKQAASVSHQLGRRTLCEAYGVAGWDSTFEHYKRVGDWLMVHGIDFMDQHLSLSTIRGARKRDHPQSFSEISAWWPYYKLHGDYLGRVSYMLSRGSPANRLLVLKPTTSGFISTCRYGLTPELQNLRSTYSELMQALADHQIDFDLGDEYLLEWFGKVEGKRLAVAKTSYDLLVWPVGMVNVRHETLPILTRYLEAGGEVLALSPPADYVDGESSEEVKKLAQHFSSQWHFMDSLPNLLSGIRSRLEPRIVSDRELPNVGLSERFLENGDRILFIANIGLENVTAKVAVCGGSLEKWDLVTGATGPVPYELVDSGRLQFPLNLPLGGSEMYLVKQETLIPTLPPKPFVFSALKPDHWQILPDGSNVLVLDYCGLKVAGADFPDINTWGANWIIWQKHGFDRPFWDNAVQFKTRVYDRNHYPADSGFAATFRFQVDDGGVLPGLELVAEVPELYQISLNGQSLSFKESNQWLDPRLRSLSVTKWAKVGGNVVRILGQPFDVRMELENIYLKGNFNVASAEKGFRLISTQPLDLGSWAKQGWPFFSGTVHYQAELTVPQKMTRLRVQLGDWAGSVVAIDLDKKEISVLGWRPYEIEVPVIPGKHTIGIRVISNPRNLFGPFHNPTKPRMEAWPKFWAEFPEHQPPGASYDVLNYGLLQWPVISVGMPKK